MHFSIQLHCKICYFRLEFKVTFKILLKNRNIFHVCLLWPWLIWSTDLTEILIVESRARSYFILARLHIYRLQPRFTKNYKMTASLLWVACVFVNFSRLCFVHVCVCEASTFLFWCLGRKFFWWPWKPHWNTRFIIPVVLWITMETCSSSISVSLRHDWN